MFQVPRLRPCFKKLSRERPKRFSPMTCRVPSLAKNFQSPNLKVQNRFACLEDEHPDGFFWNQTPDVPETTQNSSVEEAIGRKAQTGNVTLDKETTEQSRRRRSSGSRFVRLSKPKGQDQTSAKKSKSLGSEENEG